MKHDLQLRRFILDVGVNFTRLIVMTVLGIGLSIVLARGLGPEGRGLYDLSLLLPQIVQVVANLGVPFAIVYYVANTSYELHDVIPSVEWLSIGLSVVGLIICIMIIAVGGGVLFPEVPLGIFAVSFAIVPLLYLRTNLGSIFQGRQDFRTMSLIELIPSLIGLVLLILLVWLLHLGVMGALAALITGNLVAVAYAILRLKRLTSTSVKSSPGLKVNFLRQVLSYGWKQQINVIVVFLLLRVDTFLLSLIGGGATSVGIYSIAVLLGERIWTLSGFAGNVLLPRIASWQGEKDRQNQLTVIVMRHTFWLSLVILLGVLIFGKWLIGFLYGDEFGQAADALFWLLPGIMMFNFARVVGADISGRGHPEILSLHSAIAFGINLILNLLLIPQFDIVGAALASSVAYSYFGVSLVIVFCRTNGVHWLEVWWPTSEDIRRLGRLLTLTQSRLKKWS